MKKFAAAVIALFAAAALGTTANAARCDTSYMQDPCSVDGYSIVQTERFVRGRHNWMYDIHHFGEKRKVKRSKRFVRKKRVLRKKRVSHTKRRYKYVRRCRTVKVRL